MRRLIALILALLMVAGGAQAAFSPVLAGLNEEMELRASLKLDTLSPLGESSIGVMNAWLSGAEIVVNQRQSSDTARARTRLTMDDMTLMDVVSMHRKDYSLTAFAQDDETFHAYLTAAGRKDALSLLVGDTSPVVAPDALIKGFIAASKDLYALLETAATPKTVKSSTSIKNAGSSSQYIEYKLTDAQMNEIWPKFIDTALPFFDAALLSEPTMASRARDFLSALTFSGECRFKRMLDKAGEDIGLQFTARAADGEDARKVTVFGGYAEGAGMYMSFALPAVKGKNNMKLTVAFKLTEKKTTNTLTTDVTYTNTLGSVTETADISSTLKNTTSDGENITGKITVTTKKDGVKAVYTIEPELTAAQGDDALEGTIDFQRKTGGTLDLKGTLTLTLGKVTLQDDVTEDIAQTLDFSSMTDEAASASLAGEKALLMSRLVRMIASLPEAERTLLTHEMRTDAWMTAPNVAPAATQAPYTVTEEE